MPHRMALVEDHSSHSRSIESTFRVKMFRRRSCANYKQHTKDCSIRFPRWEIVVTFGLEQRKISHSSSSERWKLNWMIVSSTEQGHMQSWGLIEQRTESFAVWQSVTSHDRHRTSLLFEESLWVPLLRFAKISTALTDR